MQNFEEQFDGAAYMAAETSRAVENLKTLYKATYQRLKLRDKMIARLENEILDLKNQIKELEAEKKKESGNRPNKSVYISAETGNPVVFYECPRCGAHINYKHYYCKNCGLDIDWTEE